MATQDHQQAGQLLASALIGSGAFDVQARALINIVAIDHDSFGVCGIDDARTVAPQLIGILSRWPDSIAGGSLRLKPELVRLLIESIELGPDVAPSVEDRRLVIGKRGEAYSHRFERRNAAVPDSIKWVAESDESLGYDIEDRSDGRRIEVKASTGRAGTFKLTANEWKKAQEYGTLYEIHFWGGVDLGRTRETEYTTLVSEGYPVILRDPAQLVRDGLLDLACSEYRAHTTRAPTPPG